MGDSIASNLLQMAKVSAGKWIARSDVGLEHSVQLEVTRSEAADMKGNNFAQYEERKAAEHALAALQKATEAAGKEVGHMVRDWASAQPQSLDELKYLPSELAQYYSIMYFIDKEIGTGTGSNPVNPNRNNENSQSTIPVTCDGDLLGEPVLGTRPEGCAAACNSNLDCVGFQAFAQTEGQHAGYVCYLFSKFTSAQYYTGCDGDQEEGFVQLRGAKKHNITNGHLRSHGCEKKRKISTCAWRRTSQQCANARKATAGPLGDGSTPDRCFLLPGNTWTHSHLPNYIKCLQDCCEDYDPERVFVGVTCDDILQMQSCPSEIDAYVPPNTKVAHICPVTCDDCDEPEPFVPPPKKPRVPVQIPIPDSVIEDAVVERSDKTIVKGKMVSMCQAKFSKFAGLSLKPDPSGKNKFALKTVTEANRCPYD
jgi:hypothetical protein